MAQRIPESKPTLLGKIDFTKPIFKYEDKTPENELSETTKKLFSCVFKGLTLDSMK